MARKPHRSNVLPFRKPRRPRKPPRFDAKWNDRRRRASAWRRWRARLAVFAIVLVAIAVSLYQRSTAPWTPVRSEFTICGRGGSAQCVVDGDTVRIGDRRIRLTGFDAPEMDGVCVEEQARAREAQVELARWLNAGPFELDGGADPPRDRYGRELRAARRGSQQLADHMLARNLAHSGGWADWGEPNWCR